MKQRTFGRQFIQLVQSLSIADDATTRTLAKQFESYIQSLDFSFYEVQVAGYSIPSRSGPKPALGTWNNWTSGAPVTTPIFDGPSNFTGQTTYAYVKGCRLWITYSDNELLNRPRRDHPNLSYVQSWDEAENDLPDYWDFTRSPTRTSIILPLRTGRSGAPFGHMNLEHRKSILATELLKEEFSLLAEGVAILYRLHERTRDGALVESAVKDLETVIKKRVVRLAPLTLFVASSSQADPKVLDVLSTTLDGDEFKDKIRMVPWFNAIDHGSISRALVEQITTSSYGIVYLSQPTAQPGPKFVDNPNALFEAGMYYGLCAEQGGATKAWIPMREQDSPPCPADFRDELLLVVPRTANGEVDADNFRALITKRVRAMIEKGERDNDVIKA